MVWFGFTKALFGALFFCFHCNAILYLAIMRLILLLIPSLIIGACSVPKVINESGRVTPKGHATGGVTYMSQISTITVTQLGQVARQALDTYQAEDTSYFDNFLKETNEAMVSYALDPISFGPQFYLRVGVADRFEVGYLRAKKANMFQAQYQFMGFRKDNPEAQKEVRWFGSVGLRYSWNKYSLPDYFSNVQQVLKYSYGRRDFFIPIIFSRSFGPNEKLGSVSFGMTYGHHSLNYSFIPSQIFSSNGVKLQGVDYKNRFSSLGLFANVKLGYKFIYLIPSISMYYQKYGTYPLLDKSTITLEGWTFVPGISLQLNTFSGKLSD